MKKINLEPKICVYRNYINDVDKLFSFIKKTKENTIKTPFIKQWKDWDEKGFVSESDSIYLFDENNIGKDDQIAYDTLFNLTDTLNKIAEEYIEEWKDIGNWQFDINDWSLNNPNSKLKRSSITYLMYTKTKPNSRIAMIYHTDQHQFDMEAKKNHHILTLTVYLNDDYDGGELSFLDEKNLKISYFKPKQGDIIVFPSFYPYFHGVDPIISGEKYLARTFITYSYDGSKKWNSLYERLGETWIQMEADRIKKEWSNAKYFRIPVFEDDSKDLIENLHTNAGNVIPFSYTKKEAKQKFTIEWND